MLALHDWTTFLDDMSSEIDLESLKADVWKAVGVVEDPEIGLALTELGLIYDVKVSPERKAEVTMTLTSMGCPYGPELTAGVHAAANGVEGIEDAHVDVVWSPPWDPREMASEDAKMHLGIY